MALDLLSSGFLNFLGGGMGAGGGVRTAEVIVSYSGTDITAIIKTNLIETTYKDMLEGKGDTLDLLIADPDYRFSQQWTFEKGKPFAVTLEQDHWIGSGMVQINLGTFYIDEIDLDYPPSTIHLRCSAIDPSNAGKWQKKNRAWENTSLKSLAGQVATELHLSLQYKSSVNPTIARIDQTERSDYEFLKRQCKHYSLSVAQKPAQGKEGGQLLIFDVLDAEAAAPKWTLVRPANGQPGGIENGGILKVQLVSTADDTYRSATVSYHNVNTGKTTKATSAWVTAGDEPTQSEEKQNTRGFSGQKGD
jgi:hypothetical protein